MNDKVIVLEVRWLIFEGEIYNCAFIYKATKAGGGNTTLTFQNGDILVIPNSLAKEIFFV